MDGAHQLDMLPVEPCIQRRGNLFYPKCWAMVSGGKDGMSSARCLEENGLLEGVIAFDTKLNIPEWRDFIEDACREQKWRLEVYTTPESYEWIVERFGFPGWGQHKHVMNRLKGRCVKEFKQRHPDGILASGARKYESARRALNAKPVGLFEKVPTVAPIYDWTTPDTWKYFKAHNLKRSPAYHTLQISGDCLCGAFAREDEPAAIQKHYPKIWDYFESLSAKIKGKLDTHGRRLRSQWGWGAKAHHEKRPNKNQSEMLICAECGDGDNL